MSDFVLEDAFFLNDRQLVAVTLADPEPGRLDPGTHGLLTIGDAQVNVGVFGVGGHKQVMLWLRVTGPESYDKVRTMFEATPVAGITLRLLDDPDAGGV